jgi:hypothetical protein
MSDEFDYAKAFPNPPVVRDALSVYPAQLCLKLTMEDYRNSM